MAIPSYPQRPYGWSIESAYEKEFDDEKERAEQGDVSAMLNVAKVYYTGWEGVLRADLSEARKWYGTAAAKGNAEAASWTRRIDESDRLLREKIQRALKNASRECCCFEGDLDEITKNADEAISSSVKLVTVTQEDKQQRALACRMKGYAEFSDYRGRLFPDLALLDKAARSYLLGGDVQRSDPPEVGLCFIDVQYEMISSGLDCNEKRCRKAAFLAAKRLLGDQLDFDTSCRRVAELLWIVINGICDGLDGKPDIAAAEKACERYLTLDDDFSEQYKKGKEIIEKARRRIAEEERWRAEEKRRRAEEEWRQKSFLVRLFTKPKYR